MEIIVIVTLVSIVSFAPLILAAINAAIDWFADLFILG